MKQEQVAMHVKKLNIPRLNFKKTLEMEYLRNEQKLSIEREVARVNCCISKLLLQLCCLHGNVKLMQLHTRLIIDFKFSVRERACKALKPKFDGTEF